MHNMIHELTGDIKLLSSRIFYWTIILGITFLKVIKVCRDICVILLNAGITWRYCGFGSMPL